MRRPRTEARPRRADYAKGLTNQGPLQKGGQRRVSACPPSFVRLPRAWWARFALPTLRIYAEIAFAESTWLRSKNFWILPVEVFGMAPNTTAFGVLKPDM